MPVLENIGSLITYKDESGQDVCLGYLFHVADRGTYDPSLGRVEVGPEDAAKHNAALDEALLAGLDQNCEVGQGGTFYAKDEPGGWKVRTFTGCLVSDDTEFAGRRLLFRRAGKTFRGRLRGQDELFGFTRIA